MFVPDTDTKGSRIVRVREALVIPCWNSVKPLRIVCGIATTIRQKRLGGLRTLLSQFSPPIPLFSFSYYISRRLHRILHRIKEKEREVKSDQEYEWKKLEISYVTNEIVYNNKFISRRRYEDFKIKVYRMFLYYGKLLFPFKKEEKADKIVKQTQWKVKVLNEAWKRDNVGIDKKELYSKLLEYVP